ncbi:hypothetical protein F7725_025637 [Dissostichus mawsoni]|uniref:TTF-type domain-containing protein n=1 Tax=Dissostichus mawsoni TaxID=36200 RepID=A0A7J5XC73_DISMA|nr:hypothetical protein F7725_025637 [Dissostichus mawsoni]
MKRKRADIASFCNKKNPAEAQEKERQGQMEKGQTDRESEGEESPVRPADISKSRADQLVQPHPKLFPRTLQGDRRRHFQASWYNVHSWLEYSQIQDSAHCFACRHFGLPNTDSVFTSALGFKNWKKATFRDGGFTKHVQ